MNDRSTLHRAYYFDIHIFFPFENANEKHENNNSTVEKSGYTFISINKNPPFRIPPINMKRR